MFRLLSAAALLLTACSKEAVEPSAASAPVLSRQYRQKSVTVIVSASETNITTAGKIQLMIDVHAPPGAEVGIPEMDAVAKPFLVSDSYSEPVQTLPNGKHLHRRGWMLIPSLPGETVFQPFKISAGSTTVETDAITVNVTSLLPKELTTFEIKDIAGPAILLPEEKQRQKLWLILSGIAVAVACLAFAIKLIRRPQKPVVLAPHETAFLALKNLPADELEKIQALTVILLSFIGARFNLPTTTRTVHEILPHLPKELLLGRRQDLEKMLIESEQIRFSNKVPPGFADELENYAHAFVEEMKEAPCD